MRDKKGTIAKYALIRPCGGVTAQETALALSKRIVIIPFLADPWTIKPSEVKAWCGGDTRGVIVEEEEVIARFRSIFHTALLKDLTLTFFP